MIPGPAAPQQVLPVPGKGRIHMKKTGWKEAVRSIRKTWVSWIAMSVVTMIGCGVCFGVYFYGNALQEKGDRLFAETAYEDMGIIATEGLSAEEIAQLTEVPGVKAAAGCYYFPDAVLKTDGAREQVAVYTITEDISAMKLLDGKLPEGEAECALTADEMSRLSLQPGDQVELFLTDEDLPEGLLKAEKFTVTAVADHPESVQNESDMFVYLPEAAVDTEQLEDYYTYIRIDADVPEGISSLGTQYAPALLPVKNALKEKLAVIGPQHDKDMKQKAQDKLDEEEANAREKLADAQTEIDDADGKIEDAEAKIEDAHDQVADAEKKLADADEQIADGEKKLADAEGELKDNADKLAKAKDEIKKGEKDLKKGRKELKAARKKLDAGKKELDAGKKELLKAQKQLSEAENEYEKARQMDAQFKAGVFDSKDAEEELKKQNRELYEEIRSKGYTEKDAKKGLKKAGKELEKRKKEFKKQQKIYDKAAAEYSEKEKEYKKAESKIKQGEKDLAASKKKVEDGEKELAKAEKELKEKKQELEDNKKELEDKKKELEDKKKELADNEAELEDAKTELADAKKEYQEKKEETDEKIADAQKEIDDLTPSGYGYVLRSEKSGHVALAQDISILHSMAMIFNLFFIVIGAIVIVSTITIRIDNDKKLIGTMKAYGFKNSEIITKYVFYGVSAILVGLVLSVVLAAGLQAAMRTFIGGLFIVRPDGFAFYPGFFLIISAVEILAAFLSAAIATAMQISKKSAVDLMNGTDTVKKKKKKSGGQKNSGGLYTKLIVRNMVNDLPRVITSVVIIAGSCLMMGVGFTMKGSIDHMMEQSAAEINQYTMEASFVSEFSEEKMEAVTKLLADKGIEYKRIHKQVTKYGFGDAEEYTTILSAPEEVYQDYILLTDMAGNTVAAPAAGQAVIGNRISEALKIRAGDTISIFDTDFNTHDVTAAGVCRNYTGKLICLSQEDYQNFFGQKAEDNTLLIRTDKETGKALETELSAAFPELTISFTDEFPELLESIRGMANIIVYILSFMSVLMSLFVLLNLVNIFVGRRRSELIIMAVNGFSRSEQIGYLLRETIMTTSLGLVIGFVGCFIMTEMVVRMIESDGVMFVRAFNAPAALLAAVLETGFALVINLYAYRKIRKWKLTDINS